jgi:hypothetical protein
MGFFSDLKTLIAKSVKKDNKSNFGNDGNETLQDSSTKMAEGFAIFIIVLGVFIFIAMLYVVIKSFILALRCNYGKNADKKTTEIIVLILGMFLFPIVNVIYIFWKPGECIKATDISNKKRAIKKKTVNKKTVKKKTVNKKK